jgi:hypothetical protein
MAVAKFGKSFRLSCGRRVWRLDWSGWRGRLVARVPLSKRHINDPHQAI